MHFFSPGAMSSLCKTRKPTNLFSCRKLRPVCRFPERKRSTMGPAADTIAAISTPSIPAAIGILRLSGPRAAQIAAVCFKPLGRKGLLEHRPRELVYGDLLDTGGGGHRPGAVPPSPGPPTATPGRTRRSSTATAPPWCCRWGWRPCLPPGPGRLSRGSSPAGPFSTASWI